LDDVGVSRAFRFRFLRRGERERQIDAEEAGDANL
jgi:hypothetical protein